MHYIRESNPRKPPAATHTYGRHMNPPTFLICECSVRGLAPVPSCFIIQRPHWGPGRWFALDESIQETNAIEEPSGDHAGWSLRDALGYRGQWHGRRSVQLDGPDIESPS
jgi:hypothetical protein